MMCIKYFSWLFIYSMCFFSSLGQGEIKSRIIIIADYLNNPDQQPKTEKNTNLIIKDLSADSTRPTPGTIITPTILGAKYMWVIETSKTKWIYNPLLFPSTCIVSPGDSIHIRFQTQIPIYSGIGSAQCQLQYEIGQYQKQIKNPISNLGKKQFYISLNQYLQLNKYYNDQINIILPLIESYKHKLDHLNYIWAKCFAILRIEDDRYDAFSRIQKDKHNLSFPYSPLKDVLSVWDSTMYKPWAQWLRNQHDVPGLSASYFYGFSRWEVWRKLGFILENNDTLASKPMRVKMYYNQILNNYKGLRLERTLCYLLDEQVLTEMGALNPVAQALLKDYYARSKYPAYKKWVQTLEAGRQYFGIKNGTVPFFQLRDTNNQIFTEKNIDGKFAIINFWYSGCSECKEKAPFLENLHNRFKNDTNVIFLHVSVDTDKTLWLINKDKGLYAPKGGIHLYTNGTGRKHEMLSDLGINTYPSTRYITANGMMIMNAEEPDWTKNNEQWLENLIKTKQPYAEDGPYVITESDGTKAYYINGGAVVEGTSMAHLTAATDQYNKKLNFSLQKNITIPPSEYAAPEKMLALSDIEGNFTAFRELLQAHQIIDSNFNWIFGRGHLVFAGDMFDRGEQVTECLWLIYSLEEKAKAAGGMVHFILGNHEIMNLNGQDKYVTEKYKKNYKLLGKTLSELYNENSELGRWLRTKNIIEKIGNLLFCHGGISPDLNSMEISLDQINTKARPYYDKSTMVSKGKDTLLKILFNASKSPFWYRHYYDKTHFSKSNNEMIWQATETQVDSTCNKFGVNRIITGHTIVADTISVHYSGKIINIDTYHAKGKSEALLIENAMFFRADNKGNRVLLFKEENKQVFNHSTANTPSK